MKAPVLMATGALIAGALLARTLLARQKGAPTPAHVNNDRLDVTVTRNRETREVRVITNMGHDTALDVHHDLSRHGETEGSHAVVTAWEQTGHFRRSKERQ